MDQRELESRVKALTKSVAANEPPENALRLLESLKKDASPTEEMLRVSVIRPSFRPVLLCALPCANVVTACNAMNHCPCAIAVFVDGTNPDHDLCFASVHRHNTNTPSSRWI